MVSQLFLLLRLRHKMERKPDWLPGFPVQIYCNRRLFFMSMSIFYRVVGVIPILFYLVVDRVIKTKENTLQNDAGICR